jgi:lysophospholipase L1-like esterase
MARFWARWSLPLVLLSVSALISGPADRRASLPGRSPVPAFTERGELAIFFRDGQDRLGLSVFDGGRPGAVAGSLSGLLLTPAPVLARDLSGRIWAAWAEQGAAGNEIHLARLENRGLRPILSRRIGSDFPVSLDLAVDGAGRPWLAGVFYSGSSCSVRILPPRPGGFVRIDSSDREISNVRLVAGPARLWAFWTRDEPGRYEMRAVSWNAASAAFGAPESVNPASRTPRLFLRAAAGPDGEPWLVWSEFDGRGYEIRLARHLGGRWTADVALTDNDDQDLFPSLSFLPDGSPLVVWYRSRAGNGLILAKRRSGGAWGRERILAASATPLNGPVRATVDAGRLALAWEEDASVRTAIVYLAALAGLPTAGGTAAPYPGDPEQADVSIEDTYIGFGDSITYGVIDYQYAPDLGYIPRLETLLKARFGAASIVNEGWPGEITVNGLGRMAGVLAEHPARFLLLMEGTNDVIFSEISMSATAFDLKQMADQARAAGTYPLLATIIPRSDWRWGIKFYRDRIFNLNDMIRALAENLRLPLVEQFYAFYGYPEADGGWRSLLSDGVHPTEPGYELMSRTWYDQVIVLPFGPASVSVERTTQRSLLVSRPVNSLSWVQNPKVLRPIVLVAYNIFRNEDHSPQEEPIFLARYPIIGVAERYRTVDASIDPARRYRYYLQAVRRDGVEGPLSEAIHD